MMNTSAIDGQPDIVPAAVRLGTLIGGTYRVVGELGRGAMGIVLCALDESLERKVAIKMIREDVLDRDFYARFVQEARAMARVNHPNVLGIYAFGDFGQLIYINRAEKLIVVMSCAWPDNSENSKLLTQFYLRAVVKALHKP